VSRSDIMGSTTNSETPLQAASPILGVTLNSIEVHVYESGAGGAGHGRFLWLFVAGGTVDLVICVLYN